MEKKTLSERYGDEVLTDNTQIPKYEQCKDCSLRDDKTANGYKKCVCWVFTDMKPIGVEKNTEECEYYEKE